MVVTLYGYSKLLSVATLLFTVINTYCMLTANLIRLFRTLLHAHCYVLYSCECYNKLSKLLNVTLLMELSMQ